MSESLSSKDKAILAATARCDASTVQEIYSKDNDDTPGVLRSERYDYTNSDDIPAERYTSKEFLEEEYKYVWSRAWQAVGREDQIPNIGDYMVHDIGDLSFIITRTEDGSIAVHHNFCVHRARKLKAVGGKNAKGFKCPFHGWEYNLDGSSKNVPCKWDFAHMSEEDFALVGAKVDTWQGWIFINPDSNCGSLKDFMGEMWNHFDAFPHSENYTHKQVRRRIPCNWKICLEAFCEGYHTIATHPQLLPYLADANSQYDNYEGEYFNRMLNPQGVNSPHLGDMTDQEVADAMLGALMSTSDAPRETVPEGVSARTFVADRVRAAATGLTGVDHSNRSNAEMLDVIQYTLFPNFFPWGGTPVYTIGYIFKPDGDNPDSCILDIFLLRRYDKSKPRPEPAKVDLVPDDGLYADVPDFAIGVIFDQDLTNLEMVQKGLKVSKMTKSAISLANFQESRIRDLHRMLDRFIAESKASKSVIG